MIRRCAGSWRQSRRKKRGVAETKGPLRDQAARGSALASLSGQWIGRVRVERPPNCILLGMDSSVSPTHGEQENASGTGIMLGLRSTSAKSSRG
jgi:predicted RNA-binding Zn ribbon-like protein